MNTSLALACVGLIVVSLGYFLSSSNFFMKWFGLIALVVGEILIVIGGMGMEEVEDKLPVALIVGAVAAGGQKIGWGPWGRVWNKPRIIKWSYRVVGVVMFLAALCVVLFQSK